MLGVLPPPSSHGFFFPSPTRRRLSASSSRRCLVVYASAADAVDSTIPKVEYTPWLVVGLGNPGNKYHGTRHNVGFDMVDRLSHAEDIPLNTVQSKALIGLGSVGEVPVLLAKPQGYMNYCGESVGPLAAYYQVPLRHILLMYDEMSLPNAVLRLQPKGGHGHHNGMGARSIVRFEALFHVSALHEACEV